MRGEMTKSTEKPKTEIRDKFTTEISLARKKTMMKLEQISVKDVSDFANIPSIYVRVMRIRNQINGKVYLTLLI